MLLSESDESGKNNDSVSKVERFSHALCIPHDTLNRVCETRAVRKKNKQEKASFVQFIKRNIHFFQSSKFSNENILMNRLWRLSSCIFCCILVAQLSVVITYEEIIIFLFWKRQMKAHWHKNFVDGMIILKKPFSEFS